MFAYHLTDAHHHSALLHSLPLLLKIQQKCRLCQKRQVHFLPTSSGNLRGLGELFIYDDAPIEISCHLHRIPKRVHLAQAIKCYFHFFLVVVLPQCCLAIDAEGDIGRVPWLRVFSMLRGQTGLLSRLVITVSKGKERQIALVGSFLQSISDPSSVLHLLKAIGNDLNPSTMIDHQLLHLSLLLLTSPNYYFSKPIMRSYHLLQSNEEMDALNQFRIIFIEDDMIKLIIISGAGDSKFWLALRHSSPYVNYIDSLYFVELAINSRKTQVGGMMGFIWDGLDVGRAMLGREGKLIVRLQDFIIILIFIWHMFASFNSHLSIIYLLKRHSLSFPYIHNNNNLDNDSNTMLQAYDRLKETLANQNYESSLSFIQSLPVLTPRDQMLKTNFYCFLTIQRGFKINQSLTILQNCLAHPQCKGSIRALTRYHIAQVHFIEDLRACGDECEEIVAEFIGSYHMLKEHCERSQPDEEELVMLGYIIYYCLLMLGYVRGQQGRKEESQNYVAASVNLLKINNQSSQFINASNFRTKSSERQHRLDSKTY